MTNEELYNLVQECKAGKRAAQTVLYDTFKMPMFKLCLRYAKNEEDAKEMLQIGFTEVFVSIHSWREEGEIGAWIRRVVFNRSMMYLRKKLSYPSDVSLDVIKEFHDKDITILEKLEAEHIYKLILALPIGYRTVFNLFTIEGLSHEEIAKELGININTSKSQLRKAKQQLQNKILETNRLEKKIKTSWNG